MDVDDEEESDELSMIDIRARVLAAGFTKAQLMDTIHEMSGFSYLQFKIARLSFSTRILMCGSEWRITQSCALWRSSRTNFSCRIYYRAFISRSTCCLYCFFVSF